MHDWLGALPIGLVLYAEWRLLKRWVLTRGVCLAFPTGMLALRAAVDAAWRADLGGRILTWADWAVTIANTPALLAAGFAAGAVGRLVPDALRLWVFSGLLWLSWYVLLLLRRHFARLDSPATLDLNG